LKPQSSVGFLMASRQFDGECQQNCQQKVSFCASWQLFALSGKRLADCSLTGICKYLVSLLHAKKHEKSLSDVQTV
jgi:hypothetical protein